MKYPSIRIEGAILSPEILERLDRDDALGQRPVDFALPAGTRIKDEIVRAWAHAQNYWRAYQDAIDRLKPDATGTSETRQLWMLPLLRLLGYDLDYSQRGEVVNGKTYAISHRLPGREGLPVHIIGPRHGDALDDAKRSTLDTKSAGTSRMSPHALVQEYLNLTEHLYGLIGNGRQLRLLRDSARLIRLSYVEFDLVRMFEDQLTADFAVLYRLLHASRLPQSQATSSQSLIERYHQNAIDAGARIRDGLRNAVEYALSTLANGFLSHKRNDALRDLITNGQLDGTAFYQHLLRLIYRLLFLMVIEERRLVFPSGAGKQKIRVYFEGYSIQRLRRLANQRAARDTRHEDLWLGLRSTFALFEEEKIASNLGLAPLAGALFSPQALGPLAIACIDNATLLTALDRLCNFEHPDTHQRTTVNYGALATEEFGSVYEALLELHPVIHREPFRFSFKVAAGSERKTTGSYYTPSSLVECLLDSALDPVLEERVTSWRELGYASSEESVLRLRICDPACGSGHFLIAAAQRIARRLASLRAGDEEPAPDQLRHALRQVIGNCLYGVDINPMAVELCKVTLWLEATEPGKPLSFLDHHIQCGNSLLSVTPRLLYEGLPDAAFKPIAGDDKAICAEAKKRNKDERKQLALFHGAETKPWERLGNLPAAMLEVDIMSDDTASELHNKEARYAELIRSSSYLNGRFLADAWCAAFVWKKTIEFPYPITNDILRKIERNPHDCTSWMRDEIQRVSDNYQFFHWHLAFPDVFRVPKQGEKPDNEQTGWNGGFDLVLGNPPWERVKLQEKEWFADRQPEIAKAPNAAARKRLIQRLIADDPRLAAAFAEAARKADGESHFLRSTDEYPLCGRGDINLYAVFAERMRQVVGVAGRMGTIVPSGIATDDTTKLFFNAVMDSRSLVSLFDFENKGLFAGVHSSFKFCLFTAGSGLTNIAKAAQFVFFAHSPDEVHDSERRFSLSTADIALLNPNTRTCPIFRSARDAALTKEMYQRAEIISSVTPRIGFFPKIDMSDEVESFLPLSTVEASLPSAFPFAHDGTEFLQLYESKLVWQYDHRFGTFAECSLADQEAGNNRNPSFVHKVDAARLCIPRYFVPKELVDDRYQTKNKGSGYLLAVRRLTNATNERTAVFSATPYAGCGNSMFVFDLGARDQTFWLVACGNSFAFDYVTRNKMGGTNFLQFIIEQLPVLRPTIYEGECAWSGGTQTLGNWLLPRVLELIYTAWDLEPFARDCGSFAPPFLWDEARRFHLRCELDAAFFHLYGLSREDADYILNTFPIVRRKDEERNDGKFITKLRILELYDAMLAARASGNAYQTQLNPTPASFRVTHAPRLPEVQRIAFKSDEKFLLVFVQAFLKHTREEASLDLLDATFHLLRHRAARKAEIVSTLGDDANVWLSKFNDSLPNDAFLPFLKRLESDKWIRIDRSQARVEMTDKFPEVSFDEWRSFDVAAALHVIARRPEVIELVISQKGAALAGREFSAAKS
jgi:hypothetical protein